MSANGDHDSKERRIRDMLGLIKFCLETTAKEDASGDVSSNIPPMDPDRRDWLEQAINSMTVDTTRQLLENLALVKETVAQLESDPNHDIALQKTCDALGNLTDLCEDMDYAVDFSKLDGFAIFKPLIGCKHEELIVKACELVAALVQNNPVCQDIAMQTRLLEKLVDFVDLKDSQQHLKARPYALYAVSSIIRSNPTVRRYFENQIDGLTVLLSLLNYRQLDEMLSAETAADVNTNSSVYWWRKLRIRSIFLFQTLCLESEAAPEFFFQKQALKQLSEQLKNSKDPEVREHLLQATKTFMQTFNDNKLAESIQHSPELKDIVEGIYKHLTIEPGHAVQEDGAYDLSDSISSCKDLMQIIDNSYHLRNKS